MSSLLRISVVCFALLVIGCGPGSTPVEQPDVSVEQLIRQDLQVTADNGQLGSEMMSIQGNLTKLAEQQPEKAAELSKDLEELQKLSGPPAEAKAKEMMEKL